VRVRERRRQGHARRFNGGQRVRNLVDFLGLPRKPDPTDPLHHKKWPARTDSLVEQADHAWQTQDAERRDLAASPRRFGFGAVQQLNGDRLFEDAIIRTPNLAVQPAAEGCI
jgi:hypothetical protein